MNFSFKKTPAHFNVGARYNADLEHSKPFIESHKHDFRGNVGYLSNDLHLMVRVCSDSYVPLFGHYYNIKVSMIDSFDKQVGSLETLISQDELDKILLK